MIESSATSTSDVRWGPKLWGTLVVLCGALFLDALDISGNGVEIGGVDMPLGTDADVTRNVTVSNNHLYALPREF
ncbi:hypothetical protein ACFQ1S_13340, partial [Kibdelosporangium lantanae]